MFYNEKRLLILKHSCESVYKYTYFGIRQPFLPLLSESRVVVIWTCALTPHLFQTSLHPAIREERTCNMAQIWHLCV